MPFSPQKKAERRQRYRQKKLAKGLCYTCGQNPLVTMIHCESCRNKRRKGGRVYSPVKKAGEKVYSEAYGENFRKVSDYDVIY